MKTFRVTVELECDPPTVDQAATIVSEALDVLANTQEADNRALFSHTVVRVEMVGDRGE